MFTGIIEETGKIKQIVQNKDSAGIVIEAEKVLEGTKTGDSIAVNGICLTATELGKNFFAADIMHETLKRSSFLHIKKGDVVNLERAMRADGRWNGHMVTGHVDGTGEIKEIKKDGIAVLYKIKSSQEILHHIVEKGSIAIDGISLTIAELGKEDFTVSIIPHTAQETTLSQKKKGEAVNLENDIIGKYVEKFTKNNPAGGKTEVKEREKENERWKNLCMMG